MYFYVQMENRNHDPWELDNPPPRRNDQGVFRVDHNNEHILDDNGAHEQDHIDTLAQKIAEFGTLH